MRETIYYIGIMRIFETEKRWEKRESQSQKFLFIMTAKDSIVESPVNFGYLSFYTKNPFQIMKNFHSVGLSLTSFVEYYSSILQALDISR